MRRWKSGTAAMGFVVVLVSPAWGTDLRLNNWEAQILYRDQNAGAIRKSPLPYNNEGIVPQEGFNFYLRVPWAQMFGPLEVTLEPLIAVNDNVTGTLHKGYLRYKGDRFNLDIGKESLWWGPGVHGGLFLTNNAQPLTMLRLFNADPYRRGLLRYLPLKFDLFVSRLEKERVVPAPYFQGTRISLAPHPQFTIGFNRMIIMGGKGRPGITPARYWDIWFGENKEGDAENANSIAGIDFEAMFPGMRLYGEYGGEDEAGYFLSKEAYLIGASFPQGGLMGKDFTIEYADITNPAWYVHSLYQSGYTYKGRILGHHVGGAARDLYLEQTIADDGPRRGKIRLDYEERGKGTEYQMGIKGEFEIGGGLSPWTIQPDLLQAWVCNEAHATLCHSETTLVSVSLVGKF